MKWEIIFLWTWITVDRRRTTLVDLAISFLPRTSDAKRNFEPFRNEKRVGWSSSRFFLKNRKKKKRTTKQKRGTTKKAKRIDNRLKKKENVGRGKNKTRQTNKQTTRRTSTRISSSPLYRSKATKFRFLRTDRKPRRSAAAGKTQKKYYRRTLLDHEGGGERGFFKIIFLLLWDYYYLLEICWFERRWYKKNIWR